jgi:hypothetical protein
VSLGRGSGATVARDIATYNVLPPQSSHPRDGTAPEASITDLREALSTLESKMASLMSERERLERSLEQAVRLQAPIQHLPSELLASIFTIGVLGAEEEDTLMLSNIVLVCRYWADVAMNTPILWSRVVVSNHVSLDKARRRLSRSKSVPLHVDINFSPQMDGRGGTTEDDHPCHGYLIPINLAVEVFPLICSHPTPSARGAVTLQREGSDAPSSAGPRVQLHAG